MGDTTGSWINTLVVILIVVVIAGALYKFMPGTISTFVQNWVTNLLASFP